MSSLIDAADQFRQAHSVPPKILFYDMERYAGKAYIFDQKVRGGFIPVTKWIERPGVLCFAGKWYDSKSTEFYALWESNDPDYLAEQSWFLFDEADVVVTYYGTNADIPWTRDLWLKAGLAEPSPYIHVDMYYAAKKFGFPSNSLREVSEQLGLPGKAGAYDPFQAEACLNGDLEAQRTMRIYNEGDVGEESLQGVFEHLRAYIPNFNLGHWYGEDTCWQCGSSNLTDTGKYKHTAAAAYPTFRCDDCGAIVKSKKAINITSMRYA